MPPTLEALWRAPGEDVATIPGSTDFGPGLVRLTSRRRRPGPHRHAPGGEGLARLGPEAASVRDGDSDVGANRHRGRRRHRGAGHLVTELDIEKPGTYWVLAEPVGGTKKIQAVGVVVKDSLRRRPWAIRRPCLRPPRSGTRP